MQRKPTGTRPMSRQRAEALRRQRQKDMRTIIMLAGILVMAVVLVLALGNKGGDKDEKRSADPIPAAQVQTTADEGGEASAEGGGVQAAMTYNGLSQTLSGTSPDTGDAGDDGQVAEDGGDAAPAVETPVPVAATATPAPAATRVPGQLRSVRFRVVGDIMACDKQLAYAKKMDYDFHDQFSMIVDVLSNADYTMGNMEGTVGKYKNSNYSGYPQFNCPETILEAIKDAGVDFLTLANNHMLDRWVDGLKNTVTWVEQYGFDHVGAYRTQEERNTPVIYEINGIKFGFVAYTLSTNTMENRGADPQGVAIGVPYLYKSDFDSDVQRLRAAGAEVVIAWPHWGDEYIRKPDGNQKKYAKKLAAAGVDIILGSHSHMVQPMSYYDVPDGSGGTRQVFCIWSLGNFITDHTPRYTDCGIVLEFTVNEHEDGSFTVDNVGYLPTYTWQQSGGVRVLPSGQYLNNRPSGMNDENYARLKESYYDIVEVIGTQFPVLDK